MIQAGDRGDRFYILADGHLHLTVDHQPSQTLNPGDWFGEIALLRNRPRTATITASEAAVVYSLDRDHFLTTVTGNPESLATADTAIAARLARIHTGPT